MFPPDEEQVYGSLIGQVDRIKRITETDWPNALYNQRILSEFMVNNWFLIDPLNSLLCVSLLEDQVE